MTASYPTTAAPFTAPGAPGSPRSTAPTERNTIVELQTELAAVEADLIAGRGASASLTARLAVISADTVAAQAAAVQRPDQGHNAAAKLALKTGDVTIAIAGDSTGNDSTEWFDLFAAHLASLDTGLTVQIPHWNDGTQAYSAATVVQTGSAVPGGVVFYDTFTRTGDLYQSTPDIGAAWTHDGTNASGDFTLNGTQAVRSADATAGTLLSDGATAGDMQLDVPIVISTTATGVAYAVDFEIKYLNASNYLFCRISVSTAGVSSWTLFKKIAGSNTSIGSGSNPLTANTADQAVGFSFSCIGTAVSATLNGNTITGSITGGDATALTTATMAGVNATVSTALKMNSWTLTNVATVTPRVLTMRNGSMPGATLAYPAARLAAMYPSTIDLLIVSSSHNYGTTVGADYLAALDAFIGAYRSLHPESGVIVGSQNPQKAPAANRTHHAARNATLRSYAASRGYGYLPVAERWAAQTDGGVALVNSDGVHPTTGASSGSVLWADVAADHFATLTAS